jgi:alpha-L-fucosidase
LTYRRNLREAGSWIHDHAEAIFNTTYWFVTPEENNLRFTKTKDAFYITCLAEPGAVLEISSPVPWVDGDEVRVVGGNMSGTVVPSERFGEGVRLDIPGKVRAADRYAWVFKVGY